MAKFKPRSAKLLASIEIERIHAGKKLTYFRLSRAIEELTGHSRHDVEHILRAYHELTGPECDFDCDLSTEASNMDNQWEKWSR